jgi:hypothetical protein
MWNGISPQAFCLITSAPVFLRLAHMRYSRNAFDNQWHGFVRTGSLAGTEWFGCQSERDPG